MLKLSLTWIMMVGLLLEVMPPTYQSRLTDLLKRHRMNSENTLNKFVATIWSDNTEFKAMETYRYTSFKTITRVKVTGEEIIDNEQYIIHFTVKTNLWYVVCSLVNVPGNKLKEGINLNDMERNPERQKTTAEEMKAESEKNTNFGTLLVDNRISTHETQPILLMELHKQIGHINVKPYKGYLIFSLSKSIAKELGIEENSGEEMTDYDSIYWIFN